MCTTTSPRFGLFFVFIKTLSQNIKRVDSAVQCEALVQPLVTTDGSGLDKEKEKGWRSLKWYKFKEVSPIMDITELDLG